MSRMTHTPRRAALLTGISIASLLLAGTILALHYLSIGSMQIRPPIVYDRVWVALSILVAIAACNTALRIAFSRPSASGLSAFGRKSAGALLLAFSWAV